MNMPTQYRPVERQAPSSSFSGTGRDNVPRAIAPSGLEASGTLDDILKVVSTVGGIAAPLIGGLI